MRKMKIKTRRTRKPPTLKEATRADNDRVRAELKHAETQKSESALAKVVRR